jgi:multicomponent Na+:H+ antiporter subunit D
VLSEEISSFIGFFALMSFSAYPLILHSESDEARSAASTYIKWVVFGEVILFVALVGNTYYSNFAGDEVPVIWVTAFLLIGFGVKAGLATLHVWLPKAHPVAPVPASALLSAVMVKVGLLGWIRFLPLGDESILVLAQPMMLLGCSAAFFGAIYGMFQNNPKTVLAYSTISQLGIVSASIGFALAFPNSWEALLPVIVFFAMHHGFAKATLFLCVGLKKQLEQKTRLTPCLWLLVLIPTLSLIGLPLTSGAFAKEALKSATSSWPLFSTFLVLSAVGTSLLMGRFIQLMQQPSTQPQSTQQQSTQQQSTQQQSTQQQSTQQQSTQLLSMQKNSDSAPRWGLILPTALCALLCVGYVYFTPAFEFKIHQSVFSTMSWAAVWPGLIGLTILVASFKLRAAIVVPAAGDILMIYQQIGLLCQKIGQNLGHSIARKSAGLSCYFYQTLERSQSLLNNSSKHLIIETPGTVMVVVLVLLFYTFVS